MNEQHLSQSTTDRYGPVLPEDEEKIERHLSNLTTLIAAALQTNRDHWTGAERALYQRLPEEVLHGVEQDACLCSGTPEDFRQECNRRLHAVVRDPLLTSSVESITGESALRPRTVYPA